MKTALKILVGIAILVVLLGLVTIWRPVEVSRVIWPVVEAVAIKDFVGITDDGSLDPSLFSIKPTGASTEAVVTAGAAGKFNP